MATGAADTLLRCILGSISMNDMDIERRPYHRNCSCALHASKGACPNACAQHRCISFGKKQSWHDFSLSIATINFSPPFSNSSFKNGSDTHEGLSSRQKLRPCSFEGK